MANGIVEGIYIAPTRGAPTEYAEQIHVVPGMGIEGDRYFSPIELKPSGSKPGLELTLIEMEAIEEICQEDGTQLTPNQTRRNIVTRRVSLNDLVGKDFTIGEVQLHGVRLCEPCNYLASRTYPRLIQSMAHRGGLRASILTDGFVHVSDRILTPTQENL